MVERNSPWLNLLPNIIDGLNLISGEQNPKATPLSRIGVWNGEEVVPMELEDYIIHVVAAEMPASYEVEALKAQAVAARTFAVQHMLGEEHCKSGHTICTDHTCCQAFLTDDELHSRWGAHFDELYEKISSAVKATDGLVMTCDGRVISAFYHSSSGGRTEDCEAVFAVALPYLISVESSGEESSPEFSTTKSWSMEEFADNINAAFPGAELNDPAEQVDVWDRTDSGRVKLVQLGNTVVTGQQLRTALKLRSTNFDFEFSEDEVVITCLGFGHGVGMSQCGANAMAKDGAEFAEILTHYYTGVSIERMNITAEIWKLFVA